MRVGRRYMLWQTVQLILIMSRKRAAVRAVSVQCTCYGGDERTKDNQSREERSHDDVEERVLHDLKERRVSAR